MAYILIIDDDPEISGMLSLAVTEMGHRVQSASTLSSGLEEFAMARFDVVFLDVMLPDGNGLQAIDKIKETDFPPEVIIITGAGDPDGAELAIRNGAWDYIEKPLSLSAVSLSLLRALQYREIKSSSRKPVPISLKGIIGNSWKIRSCLETLAQAAGSDANVLITGETGTGKELFSHAIHSNSLRCRGNFVIVDCAALPSTIVESVLFGHEKGAFTGADRDQTGLVKQADGGTLFLDEVGELPGSIQKAFLRVLQERAFRPVGSKKEVKADFRLVAATNRNLDDMTGTGAFRKDLLFRLRSISIDLPPLREHPEDIKDLVVHFVAQLCNSCHIGMKGYTPEFIDCLREYSWPGNVRELKHALECAVAAAGDSHILFQQHLPTNIRIHLAKNSLAKKEPPKEDPFRSETFKAKRQSAVDSAEHRYLEELMKATKWDIKQACGISGLSKPRLYNLLRKYGITRHKLLGEVS
ncbi:MAG: sigma-54-dependent transcriptional regulator [Syntrophobacteraceae bacterium]